MFCNIYHEHFIRNGWSSFYIETAPHIRKMFLASIVVLFEHFINGFILPGMFLLTHNDVYYNLALYGEVAYMIYATTLIGASYALKRDVTIEQMHEAVWPMLLMHHIASMILCIGCILVGGENIPQELVCGVGWSHFLASLCRPIIRFFSAVTVQCTIYTIIQSHLLLCITDILQRNILGTTLLHIGCSCVRKLWDIDGNTTGIDSSFVYFVQRGLY